MECQYIIVYIFCEFNIHRIGFRLKPLHVCRVNVMQNFYLYIFPTWSTCCVLLSELVSLLQLLKPPLIYVLEGHDRMNPSNPENLVKFPP